MSEKQAVAEQPRIASQGGSSSAPPKAKRSQEQLDRVEGLARDIFISRGPRTGYSQEKAVEEAFHAAAAFFAVADKRRAEAN